jgi:tetratricopeptide (TPR) repeat protein
MDRSFDAGIAAFNRGDYAAAADFFRKEARRRDASPEAAVFLAHCHRSLGRLSAAARVLESLLRRAPDYLPARRALTEVLEERRKLDEALAGSYRRKALALKKARRWKAAETLLIKAIALDGSDRGARGELESLRRERAERARPSPAPVRAPRVVRPRGPGKTHEAALTERSLARESARLESEKAFRTLVTARRYAQACALGESILDSKPTLDQLRAFWDPWSGSPPSASSAEDLEALAGLMQDPRLRPLATYLSVSMTDDQQGLERLAALPAKRYGWMAGWLCGRLLNAGRWAEAVRLGRASLRYRPADWTNRFRFAETLLCAGDESGALEQSELGVRNAPRDARISALAWKAELDLWLGRYQQAFDELEESCRGDFYLSWSWRGAAALLLGRLDEARALLDHALERHPEDPELRVWRAEAARLAGDPRTALRELERSPRGIWPSVEGGLAAAALGDAAGLRERFASLPWEVVEFVRAKLGLGAVETDAHRRQILEKTLACARGFRREDYRQRVWMR